MMLSSVGGDEGRFAALPSMTIGSRSPSPSAFVLLGFAFVACGDDGDPQQGSSDDAMSGFTSAEDDDGDDDDDGPDSTDADATATDDDGSTDDGDPSGVETLGEGDMRGILTFTRYLADPVIGEDRTAMAGAWRIADVGWDGVDDFVAVFEQQTLYPVPTGALDEVEHNDVPAPFAWGGIEDWVLAGTAMKLRVADTEALACLLEIGMVGDIFPVYAATSSMLQPEGCAPELADWMPDTDYDIVLYGGEVFDDNVLLDQVHTPTEFTVTSPDFDHYMLAVSQSDAIDLAWDGAGSDDDRFIVRVWDDFGRMFTILATDDGELAIPASALAVLAPGPITIAVARERVRDVPFTDGLVKAVTRVERRGYFDLFAD
jgi:hypothetical protein